MNATAPHNKTCEFGPVHIIKTSLAEQRPAVAKKDPADRLQTLLNVALATAHSAPDTRQDRIAALRARIAAGSYEINPRKIAEGLLRENPELFKI